MRAGDGSLKSLYRVFLIMCRRRGTGKVINLVKFPPSIVKGPIISWCINVNVGEDRSNEMFWSLPVRPTVGHV